ncbi:MAG: hypothetical protein GVY18_11175 [Bacteroidetes bacterium]|jgi:transmembrane sensor|nr:hypothetical protein [Bacteroidota bacterium]
MTYPTPSPAPPLPDDVRAALAKEAPEVRHDLERIWAQARPSEVGMPSDDEWRAIGNAMRPALEAAVRSDDRRPVAPASDRGPRRSSLRLVPSAGVRGIALAACIALLVAVGLFWWQQPVSVTAPAGEIVQVTLPDGSTVALNSGSTVAYTGAYGSQRRDVRLVGEGYFNVVPDEDPFVVETFNGATTVLGTSFNVRAWPDDPDAATTVSVVSGVVRLAPSDANDGLTLRAGDAAILTATADAPQALDDAAPANALAWRDGGFKFTGVPLGTILAEVERRYDVQVDVTDPTLLDDPVVLLIEKSLGAEQILRDICEYNGYDYRATDDGYEIYRPADAE